MIRTNGSCRSSSAWSIEMHVNPYQVPTLKNRMAWSSTSTCHPTESSLSCIVYEKGEKNRELKETRMRSAQLLWFFERRPQKQLKQSIVHPFHQPYLPDPSRRGSKLRRKVIDLCIAMNACQLGIDFIAFFLCLILSLDWTQERVAHWLKLAPRAHLCRCRHRYEKKKNIDKHFERKGKKKFVESRLRFIGKRCQHNKNKTRPNSPKQEGP